MKFWKLLVSGSLDRRDQSSDRKSSHKRRGSAADDGDRNPQQQQAPSGPGNRKPQLHQVEVSSGVVLNGHHRNSREDCDQEDRGGRGHHHPLLDPVINCHHHWNGSLSSIGSSAIDTHPEATGTTFVELIKRQGTYLGVVVASPDPASGGAAGRPKIADLIPGSWAQRSDVLCVGDFIVGVNGVAASSYTRAKLQKVLDESDRIQLEVSYRLPPPGRIFPSG